MDPQREETIGAIGQLSRQAPDLATQGERTIVMDERAGGSGPGAHPPPACPWFPETWSGMRVKTRATAPVPSCSAAM
jgi:hypothetical protein